MGIEDITMRLLKLQNDNKEAQKLRSKELSKGWEDNEQVLHNQGLPYIPKIIRSKLISRQHDDLLASRFGIKKTLELIARKYYWPILQQDVEAYVKSCNICLASKAICHKPYRDLQLLPVLTH